VAVVIHEFVASSQMAYNGERYFETEDILVRINDFHNDMGDSLHVLTIDTLFYSLKTTDIKVSGLNLLPLNFNSEANLMDIYVPEAYIKSRSIAHFALSDSVKVGYVEFLNPEIKFFSK